MPRYYFNICCDRFEATDMVGEYCRDQTAAHQEALRAARAIIRKQLTTEEFPQRGWIEVEDEHHETILRVPLRSVAY